MGAPSARVSELSRFWVEMGHEVTVLTCFPNYPDGVVYEGYKDKIKKLYMREELNGVEVIRVWAFPTHLRSYIRRAVNYISSQLSYSISGAFLKKPDVIIATSPPPFIGLTAIFLKYLRGVPLVFEVRDLWPEVITAVGAGSSSSISYKIIDSIVGSSYRNCDHIVALTSSFKDSIVKTRGVKEEKITVIENAVDTEFFKPMKRDTHTLKDFGLEHKFIVSYVGTIGLTHGVDVILNAAEKLKTLIPELVFLLVGDGYEKDRLMELADRMRLNNVMFIGKLERRRIPGILNSSDIALVLSKKNELLEKTIFAKVFEPMATATPIIVGALGETKNLVVGGNAGVSFRPEDPSGLIECIVSLYQNPDLRKKLGDNGRKLVLEKYSRRKKAGDYIEVLDNLVQVKGA